VYCACNLVDRLFSKTLMVKRKVAKKTNYRNFTPILKPNHAVLWYKYDLLPCFAVFIDMALSFPKKFRVAYYTPIASYTQ